MPSPLSVDLRERVVAAVGVGCRRFGAKEIGNYRYTVRRSAESSMMRARRISSSGRARSAAVPVGRALAASSRRTQTIELSAQTRRSPRTGESSVTAKVVRTCASPAWCHSPIRHCGSSRRPHDGSIASAKTSELSRRTAPRSASS